MHLTAELLRQVSRGEEPLEALLLVALAHLTDTCPQCRAALGGEPLGPPESCYDDAFRRAVAAAELLEGRLPAERVRAGREATELLALSADERRGRVRRARSRFRSPVLAEKLICEGRRRLRDAPDEAAELAALALSVVERAEVGAYGESLLHELRVRARAHRADAHRACGDLLAAERMFSRLTEEMAHEPVLDPHARGEVVGLMARLRRDQHRPSVAMRLGRRAAALVRRAGGAPTPAVRLPRLWPWPAETFC